MARDEQTNRVLSYAKPGPPEDQVRSPHGCLAAVLAAWFVLPRAGIYFLWLLSALGAHPIYDQHLTIAALGVLAAPFSTWTFIWAQQDPGISSGEMFILFMALVLDATPYWLALKSRYH